MLHHNTGMVTGMSKTSLVKASGGEFLTHERCHITELCNTRKLGAASLAIARVEAGVTTRLHSLRGVMETCIVMEGRGFMEVGGDSFEIEPGDQVIIPAGVPQRVTALGDEQLRFYCLCTPRFHPECYVNLED